MTHQKYLFRNFAAQFIIIHPSNELSCVYGLLPNNLKKFW